MPSPRAASRRSSRPGATTSTPPFGTAKRSRMARRDGHRLGFRRAGLDGQLLELLAVQRLAFAGVALRLGLHRLARAAGDDLGVAERHGQGRAGLELRELLDDLPQQAGQLLGRGPVRGGQQAQELFDLLAPGHGVENGTSAR